MADEQRYNPEDQPGGHLRLLESIVGNANDAILVTEAEPIDEPGPTIVFVNESFTRTTGYSSEEIIGKTPRILQGPNTDRKQLDKIRSALSRDESVRVELLNYRKDGAEFWVEVNIVPIADEHGKTIHYVSVQREITERKQTEEELRRANLELTTIFESITDAFFSLDRQWRFTYLNSEAERVLDRTGEDLVGKSIWDEFPQAVGLKFYEQYKKAVDEQRTVEFEEIYPSLQTWFEVKAYPSEAGLSVYFRDINERKRMEEDLKASEERLRTILVQYASDIITILEADGTIRYESPAVEQVLGYRPEELIGSDIVDYVHPEDVRRAVTELATIRSSPEARGPVEVRFRHKDGSWRYLEGIGNNLLDDPDVGGVVINSRDVTARKQAEEDYRSIFENAAEGIYKTTSEGNLITANPALARIFGYDSPEELASGLADVEQNYADPERREEFVSLLQESGRVLGFEYRAYRKDRSIVWLSDSAREVRDEEGELLCYEGFIQDITERKQAEERLRESLDLLQSVMEGTTDAVFVKDLQGRYLMINKAGAEALGKSAEEVIGRDDAELFEYEDGREVMEADREIMTTGEVRTIEDTKTAEGVIRTFLATKGSYRDARGEVAGMFGVARDITNRKSAEEALQRSEGSLAAAQRMAHVGSWERIVGRDLYWSDELYRIYGFTPQQFVPNYEDFMRAIHPDDRDYVEKMQADLRRSGEQTTIECRIIRPDGEVRVLQNDYEVNYDEAGELVRMAGTVQDITERKWDERRQKVQHEVTRILAEASTLEDAAPEILQAICESLKWEVGTFWNVDHEAGVLRCAHTWNWPTVDVPELVELTHQITFSQGEGLPGRIWESGESAWVSDVVGADNSPRMPVAAKEGLRGGFGFPILLGGTVLGVVDFFCTEVRQLDEEAVEVMSNIGSQIGQFIERKQAEGELKEQREFLRKVIDTDPNLIFVKDWHGHFTLANQAVADIYNTTADGLVGKSDADFNTNEEEIESFLQADREVMETLGQKFVPEERVSDSRTGKVRWFQTVKRPLASSSDESRRLLGVATDITERKVLEERLEYQAFHDSLTDLPNRALFTDRLRHALDGAQRRDGWVAALFLDLDNFKTINDSLGHEMGDRLLISVAKRLKKCLRPGDTVARFSGDEFTLLLEAVTSINEAKLVAERILEELRYPIALDGQEMYATASIGIALSTSARSSAMQQPEDLLRQADLAMYKAKRAGKAHYEVFDGSLEAPALKRLQLGYDLRGALQREEFRVYYQPIVGLDNSLQSYLRVSGSRAIVAPQKPHDSRSSRVVGMEALLRWEHPERGLLLPDEFIPIAEESGMIIPIGEWILEQACRQGREWQQKYLGDPPLLVTVNLSAKQFQSGGMLENLARLLRESGMNPTGLGLEITENVVMGDAKSAVDTLQDLKALGVKLIVDDFGVGYSSLAYLKRFPVDFLKIDRSFIDGLREDPQNQEVVTAVISLAHALKMEIVGEGIESSSQCAQLQALGCEMGQGNYFSEPLPAEAAGALLAKNPRW